MTRIVRWNPIRDMVNFRRQMDRLFDDFVDDSMMSRFESPAWGLALDIAETDNAFVVKASVPGVNPEDLDITVNENTLTIKGEMKQDETFDEGQYHLRERRYGTFARTLTLPRSVDREAIDANYENGVLTLEIPKSEEVQPRRISIRSGTNGNSQKVIEGETA